jgi:hypothetical protein
VISATANEFIQKAAQFTIESARDRKGRVTRAEIVMRIVYALGAIGDVYWSSDLVFEHDPGDKPSFAIRVNDRVNWTRIEIRALRKGFNGQIQRYAYDLNLTNEAALYHFKISIGRAFPQISWGQP